MTIIQERSIPYALQGYDLLGQAQTGSGKTLAFCVPVLHGSIELVGKRPNFTYSLILAPTKELCVQTHTVLKGICQHIPSNVASFSVHLITGGTKITEERQRLSAGVSIVVGTPGRVHDHVQHCAKWDLSRLRYLVLDEADRMLADGFQRSLDAIVRHLPRSRQTFLFSATNSKSVGELARLSLSRTPLFISTNGNAPTTVPLDGEAVSTAISSTTLPLIARTTTRTVMKAKIHRIRVALVWTIKATMNQSQVPSGSSVISLP
ncbi:putative DEAD DEAH box helicase [Trypanosoma vivax]|nr:putative DEAD DEAH box helicase [Trypanosoma vivax]